jgi:hypothetical protein
LTAQQWRLSWSKDGGKTFTTLYEATDATNPPTLETDSADNLYVGRPDWVSREVLLYRFLASEDYKTPHISRVEKAAAGKYAMALDEARKQVYFASHNGKLARFGLDGAVKPVKLLLKRDGDVGQEYPYLHLDAGGTLHTAWTSLFVPKRRYWSIHHLQSPDGGDSWQSFAGKKLTLPVAAGEKGPSDRITLDDEFEPSTWLANFLVKDGKAHFLYLAHTKPPRQHYVRYDVATGKRELDRQPEFRGGTLGIRSLHGFFATDPRTVNSPLFCISRDERAARLVCLASDDNGATWRDHSVSIKFRQPYAIGGCREVTPDGWIIGSFTDVVGSGRKGEAEGTGRVHFFRIPASRISKP